MALPAFLAGGKLALMAGGALKNVLGQRSANRQAENEWAAAEDKRKRVSKDWTLRELPQLHGAEQKKTMGNLFARGMWGNFGRNPLTGAARSPELAAILADPWVYRDTSKLSALNPNLDPLAKPKKGGFLDYLGGVAGGALEGYGAGKLAEGSGGYSYGPPTQRVPKTSFRPADLSSYGDIGSLDLGL